MFRKSRLLNEMRTRGMDEIGLKRKAAIQRAGFAVEHYEDGLSFGNIVLVAAKGPLRLRFVRDRGISFCEARSALSPRAEDWVDYSPATSTAGSSKAEANPDFDALLAAILGESNQSGLSALAALALDGSAFSRRLSSMG